MPKLDVYIDALDEGHRELQIALDQIPNEDLWKRPHPNLLSVGEIVGHVCFWEASRLTMHLEDESKVTSELIDEAFRYYPTQLSEPVTLALDAGQVASEVARIHKEARSALLALDPTPEDPFPGPFQASWAQCLQYMAFHLAYHTGQI